MRSKIKRRLAAPFFSLMADECTDVATMEELSIFCRWVEKGSPDEKFMEIIHVKKTDAETIYTATINWLKSQNI